MSLPRDPVEKLNWAGSSYRVRLVTWISLPLLLLGNAHFRRAQAATPPSPFVAQALEVLNAGAIEKLIERAKKLQEAGDLKGATELYERVLAWSEKNKGPQHPGTGKI